MFPCCHVTLFILWIPAGTFVRSSRDYFISFIPSYLNIFTI